MSLTGGAAAFVLYYFSKKFEVKEDPRIAQILEILPHANCGGCGFPGCGGFAAACVKSPTLDDLDCPIIGLEGMKRIGAVMGIDANETASKIAVVRCNGTCEVRPRTNIYDGAKSCAIMSSLYGGETGCSYGCLGLGDCVTACTFDAIRMNLATGLPEIVEEKCVACGVCVKVCPKNIIEIRKKRAASCRIYVSCVNKDKGGVARKACGNACIGCSKCVKACDAKAITLTQNLATIDDVKCTSCGKCVPECPTKAIRVEN